MTNAVSVIRGLLIYSVCIPLAIFLGYVLANPLDRGTFYSVSAVFGLLLLPLLLKHHHPSLVLTWNTTTVIFFIPGRPNIWMLIAFASFLISLLQYILARKSVITNVPLVTRPLIFLGIVVVATAALTGGVGFKSLGAEVGGGKRYAAILAAILGYYALSMHRIPSHKAHFYLGLYFLSGITLAVGSLAPYLPSGFNLLFLLFPVDSWAYWTSDAEGPSLSVARLTGVASAATFAMYYMLGRYGIRGMLMSGRPWRFAFFLAFCVISMLGGFRSIMILAAVLFAIQFYLEGLHRTYLLPVFLVCGLSAFALSLPFASQLPYSMQRALSIFQIPVSPEVEMDTRDSNEWRLRMWAKVTPQIPQYLLLGKGFGMNIRESVMVTDMVMSQREIDKSAAAQVAQDYHNGPLSVLIPLGVFGVIGLLWFWYAGLRLLVVNYRYGDAGLASANTLLLAFFVTKILLFLLVFGSFYLDLYQFTGVLGLSVALNGGMGAKPAEAPVETVPKPRGNPSLLPQTKPAFGR